NLEESHPRVEIFRLQVRELLPENDGVLTLIHPEQTFSGFAKQLGLVILGELRDISYSQHHILMSLWISAQCPIGIREQDSSRSQRSEITQAILGLVEQRSRFFEVPLGEFLGLGRLRFAFGSSTRASFV